MISSDRLFPQQQIYNFMRTMTIKYEPLAHYINDTVVRNGGTVNPLNKATWKYYLNLTGEYHAFDTPMYVTSVDTHERILFSKQNLIRHVRTRARYIPGGVYHQRLCELYPEQVDLIKSILFPVPSMEKAILSDDLTLLQHGRGFLEEHEESVMVMKIENFLEVMKERWYFDFLDDEPYFYLTAWSVLWVQLAGLLIAARVEHIKTPYVHSFDLWNALKAEGLDDYSDILNREKAMMLYQNIKYFKANAGKESNLIILAQRLLGDLGIGIYGRIVVQQSETGAEDYQLTPQLVPVKIPPTSNALPAPIETKTVATIQTEILEKGLTDSAAAEVVATVERKLGDTRLNEFATKFLEIRPVAQNKPYAELLNTFLMETLLLSIKEGYYTKPIEVIEPLTRELIFLSPKEFIALYNYAVHKSMGRTLVNFPDKVLFYHSFTPTITAPQVHIPYEGGKLYLSQVVTSSEYLGGLNYDQNIENPAEFGEMVTRLWLRFMDHRLADQKTKIEKVRFAYSYLSDLCHQRREEGITLVSGYDNYEQWLGAGGINITDNIILQYNLQPNPTEQWANLADTIITSLIPINDTLRIFGNFTLSNSGFNRLRELFIQMCSYRVVFLQADRETSSYMVGSKWTTAYGPDDTHVYSDFIIPFHVNTRDHTQLTDDLLLHEGVKTDSVINSVTHRGYSVTTPVVDQRTLAKQGVDHVRPSVFASSRNVSTGALNLPYTGMTPTIIDED